MTGLQKLYPRTHNPVEVDAQKTDVASLLQPLDLMKIQNAVNRITREVVFAIASCTV